ncbi:kinase-like domain-containing protein [Rhizophagus diaphanus]|nr:kinase-like domain-containing protein [Rhizophagus diaphanus] [Rhizophagus sp. MUCL 43196]
MTTNNKNDNTDNKWIQWIKDGIANEFINYHDINEFQNIDCIGHGGFGKVYRANWKGSNTVVALKSLMNGDSIMKEIVNEIILMHRVNFHANIIQFFGITSNSNSMDTNYLFILEYADRGTLKNYLKNNFNKLDWNFKLKFAIQFADAVSCIHQKEIVHNDLHSDNILVHQNVIKLADLGLSRGAGVSNSIKDVLGKIPYIDPHRIRNPTKNDKKSDVYSVGVILWEISSGKKPFESYDSNYDQVALTLDILGGKREAPIDGTPDEYINIYTRCWQDNQDNRPDMQQVFSDLINLNTLFAGENTNSSENNTNQKFVNSLFLDQTHNQQSSCDSQIMNLTCPDDLPSQEDNEVSYGDDLKIIMTGIEELKDLDVNTENYKRINLKSSLENENYEVFGSIISKNNLRLENILISFELYDSSGFSAIIRILNDANIDITECYILWMIIGNPKLSVSNPKNRELQVHCIKKPYKK